MNEVLLFGNRLLLIHNMGEFRAPTANWVHPDRTMNIHLFIYVTHGKLIIWEENIEYILEKGQGLFLKKGKRHYGLESPSLDTKWMYIDFFDDPPSQEDEAQMVPFSMLQSIQTIFPFHLYRTAIPLPKLIQQQNNNYVERKLKELLGLFLSANGVRHLLLSAQVMELFLYCYQQSEKQKTYTKADIIANKIIGFLEANSDRKINRDEVATAIRMNYHYLCVVFKQKTGLSMLEFHTRLRINKAAGVLKSSELNISEVGEAFGFPNVFYFSRIFKKVMGSSPSEYLKHQYLNNPQTGSYMP